MNNSNSWNGSLLLSGLLVLVSVVATAQVLPPVSCTSSQGNPAVYANCGTGVNPQGSAAYIDAKVFGTGDICAKINKVLTSASTILPAAGAVIDARGITSTSTQVCAASPWATAPPSGKFAPVTILLPAGVIAIPSGWVVPNGTRIIGENSGPSVAGTAGNTTIQTCVPATSGCPGTNFSGTLITMGSSAAVNNCPSTGCVGIGVEDLWLDGKGLDITGIANNFAVDLSYVRHVNLYNIAGTGLSVSGTAQNSGPYSDIGFSTSTSSSGTVCAQITGVFTRGIHGLTCSSSGTAASNAVLLDASNNTIEDVEISGFNTGVEIGANNNAQNDALLNIQGGTGVSITVQITDSHTVSGISISGASHTASGATTIQDLQTSPNANITASTVGLYVLGEPVDGNGSAIGFTRFSTATGTATWVVGGAAPNPTTGCTVGSVYSNAQGSGTNHTWYVCLPKTKCSPTTATCWTPIG